MWSLQKQRRKNVSNQRKTTEPSMEPLGTSPNALSEGLRLHANRRSKWGSVKPQTLIQKIPKGISVDCSATRQIQPRLRGILGIRKLSRRFEREWSSIALVLTGCDVIAIVFKESGKISAAMTTDSTRGQLMILLPTLVRYTPMKKGNEMKIFHSFKEALVDGVRKDRLDTLMVREFDKLGELDRKLDNRAQRRQSSDGLVQPAVLFVNFNLDKGNDNFHLQFLLEYQARND